MSKKVNIFEILKISFFKARDKNFALKFKSFFTFIIYSSLWK